MTDKSTLSGLVCQRVGLSARCLWSGDISVAFCPSVRLSVRSVHIRVARSPVFSGSSRISVPISRLPDTGASIPGGGGVGRAISHIFKSEGVEGLVISTMWRLDRQTDTRKAAISDISESTYAKVTYFYRLLIVLTPCKQHKSIPSSVQMRRLWLLTTALGCRLQALTSKPHRAKE